MSTTYTIESVHGVKQTVVLVPPTKPAESKTHDQQHPRLDRDDPKSNSSSSRSPR